MTASHGTVAQMGGILNRLMMWLMIPYRILEELWDCYVENPKKLADHSIHEHKPEDSSVDSGQLTMWSQDAMLERWWGKDSLLQGLKKFNPLRIDMAAEAYLRHMLGMGDNWREGLVDGKPLVGARVCDVGCGGGFLSEALAEVGAKVTGIDMVPSVIQVAKTHWKQTHNPVPDEQAEGPEYLCTPAEKLCVERPEQYDLVICSEVLEHVVDPKQFVRDCCKLVRPGGCIIFTTINRTFVGTLYMIIFLDDFMGLTPHKHHRMYMNVKPEEIEEAASEMGFQTVGGCGCNPVPTGFGGGNVEWIASRSLSVNYALTLKRI